MITPSNILITGESRRIKIWDLRQAGDKPAEEFKQPAHATASIPEKWMGYKPVTNVTGIRYVEDSRTIVANFSGGNGLFTFDLRKRKPKDYYNYHYYPVSAFDTGDNYLKNIAISAGSTFKLQFDLRISDITKPMKDHDEGHYVVPGHKAIISR